MPISKARLDVTVVELTEEEKKQSYKSQKPVVMTVDNGATITWTPDGESEQTPNSPETYSGTLLIKSASGQNVTCYQSNFPIYLKEKGDTLAWLQLSPDMFK